MAEKYFGGFSQVDDIKNAFEVDPSVNFPNENQILFAAYEGASYEGAAIVIYEEGDKLYEVNGSHCSCYGLEGQWSPEETSWEALKKRKLDSYEYDKDTIKAFRDLINAHTKRDEE